MRRCEKVNENAINKFDNVKVKTQILFADRFSSFLIFTYRLKYSVNTRFHSHDALSIFFCVRRLENANRIIELQSIFNLYLAAITAMSSKYRRKKEHRLNVQLIIRQNSVLLLLSVVVFFVFCHFSRVCVFFVSIPKLFIHFSHCHMQKPLIKIIHLCNHSFLLGKNKHFFLRSDRISESCLEHV